MATDFTDARTERDMEQELASLLEGFNVMDDDETPVGVARVSTFDDHGILTRNRGLIVRLDNGAEFQLTIVQSRDADDNDDTEGDV